MKLRANKAVFSLLFLVLVCAGNGQDMATIEGKIFDRETKDPLPAYVMLEETGAGITADADGHFKLRVRLAKNAKTTRLSVWLIGYKKKDIEANIGEFLSIALDLEPLAVQEIVVSADSVVSDDKNQKTVTLNKMDIYTIPGTAADPVHASQVLPGVNALPDTSSLIIRGGAPDEVGYFFDGIEIRHPFLSETMHESYFSIFDNQVVHKFNISTSGFHPKYGDALSGIMDISAKDTISKKEGGLGLSVLGLNSYVGWPLTNDIGFVGSYDRGFSDLLTELNSRGGDRRFRTAHAFGKFIVRANASNLIRIYGLYDSYTYSQAPSFGADSENTMAAVSWTSTPSQNFVSKLLLSWTRFDVALDIEDSLRIKQRDDVLQARWDGLWDLERHFLEFGTDVQSRSLETSLVDQDQRVYQAQGTRLGFYLNDKFRISDNIFMNLGGRIVSLDVAKTGWNFDPRVSVAWLLTRNDIVRVSAGAYHMFGDYFTLKKNPDLRPKTAVHCALSYDHIQEETELRATLYDKEYRRLFVNQPDGLVSDEGRGYARGAEFFIKKMKKRYDAIFVYNFLHSRRKENDAVSLAPSPYEISHSLTGIFKWKWKTWSLGFRYSYASGRPYTPLVGREWDPQSEAYIPVWGAPYSQRYPFYQRMDINGSKTLNIFNRLVVLYFGITNVLNNNNILRYEYADDYSCRKDQQSIFGRSFFVGIYFPFF
jgi:hypothetical protein